MMNEVLGMPTGRAFVQWIIRNRKREAGLLISSIYVAIILAGRTLGTLPGGTPATWQAYLSNYRLWLPSLLQWLTLLPLPIACYMVELPTWLQKPQHRLAQEACIQFRTALALLVSAWWLFYVLVFVHELRVFSVRWEAWIDLVNNLQGVFLFICYWILTAKTASQQTDEQLNQGIRPLWSVYSILLWAVVVFLMLGIALPQQPFRSVFQLISGLWVGVSLALLIGCLEGQYLGQPRAVTFFLYLYAALQLSYVGFFQQPDDLLEDIATITSLPLKLLFIGLWCWLLQNGLLAFYMKKTRQAIDDVRREWEDFSGASSSQDL